MAGYIFEEMTAAQAASFNEANDTLLFRASPQAISATYTPATGLQVAQVAISANGTTLSFAADQVDGVVAGAPSGSITSLAGGSVMFNSSGGAVTVTDGNGLAVGLARTDSSGAQFTYNFTVDAGARAHTVIGAAGADTISAGSATGANYLYGGAGADSITAGSGNNHIYGNTLTTQVGAADGADTIVAGAGSNVINGNAGNDRITVGVNADGAAVPAVVASTGSNRVSGGNGNDTITVQGNGANSVNGNLGNDYIDASTTTVTARGINTLRGGQGNDVVIAGHGNDVIMGDIGNDVLVSGLGTNHVTVMTGGAGIDTFDFTAAGSGDTAQITVGGTATTFYQGITDFTVGTDILALQGGAGSTATAANDVLHIFATNFSSASEATQAALNYMSTNGGTEVVAAQVGTATFVYSDYNAGAAEIVKLDGVTATGLTASSFATSAYTTPTTILS